MIEFCVSNDMKSSTGYPRFRRRRFIRSFLIVFIFPSFIFTLITGYQPREHVQNLGVFAENRKRFVLGQDGCTPIRTGNQMLWTFGDTILGTWKGGMSASSTLEETASIKGMIANSLAVTDIPTDGTIKDLRFSFFMENGQAAPFIKTNMGENPARIRLWAADGIEIDSVVYIYYMMIRILPAAPKGALLPIRVMGTGLAEWNRADPLSTGSMPLFRRTVLLFYADEPVFGDSVIRHGEYLYVTGHGPGTSGMAPAYIARVRPEDIRSRAAYRFLQRGGTWSSQLKTAMPLFNDVMGEFSLSFNEYMREFIITYCAKDGTIRCIVFSDFTELETKKPSVIYRPPPLPEDSTRIMFYYSGKEIFYTRRAIYAIYINPAIYQPILLKIPYASLDECVRSSGLIRFPAH